MRRQVEIKPLDSLQICSTIPSAVYFAKLFSKVFCLEWNKEEFVVTNFIYLFICLQKLFNFFFFIITHFQKLMSIFINLYCSTVLEKKNNYQAKCIQSFRIIRLLFNHTQNIFMHWTWNWKAILSNSYSTFVYVKYNFGPKNYLNPSFIPVGSVS